MLVVATDNVCRYASSSTPPYLHPPRQCKAPAVSNANGMPKDSARPNHPPSPVRRQMVFVRYLFSRCHATLLMSATRESRSSLQAQARDKAAVAEGAREQ